MRTKMLEASQMEYYCMTRLRQEVGELRTQLQQRDKRISTLMKENKRLQQENQLKDSHRSVQHLIDQLEDALNNKQPLSGGDAENHHYYLQHDDPQEPYDHGRDAAEFYRITRDFYDSLRADESAESLYEVKMISKAILTPDVEAAFTSCCKCLNEPTTITRLYYCASITDQKQVESILNHGFTTKEFTIGDYGHGLHFSKHPSKAVQHSVLGKLILADVCLGNSQTVLNKDPSRQQPSEGHDSITTPGRLTPANDLDAMFCEEYIVFNPKQVKPLCTIDFTPIGMSS